MATNVQRWQALGNALLNKTATPGQLARLGEAIAFHSTMSDIERYPSLTNDEKAGFCLDRLHSLCVQWVKSSDSAKASAAQAAAAVAVDTEFAKV